MTTVTKREILQIRIKPEHIAAPDDDLNRTINGSYAGIPAGLAWERARGVWRIKKKRARAVDAVFVIDRAGTVLAVAHVRGVQEFHGKYALVGTVLDNDPRIGQPSPYPYRFRSAIGYHQAA